MTRTYGDLIRELGLTPCHGILPTGHYCGLSAEQHTRGVATGKVIHHTDEVVRK